MLLLCSMVCSPEHSDPAWTCTDPAQDARTIFVCCSLTSILIFHDSNFLSSVGVLTCTPITTAWEVANELLGFNWDTKNPDLALKLLPPKKKQNLSWNECSMKQDKAYIDSDNGFFKASKKRPWKADSSKKDSRLFQRAHKSYVLITDGEHNNTDSTVHVLNNFQHIVSAVQAINRHAILMPYLYKPDNPRVCPVCTITKQHQLPRDKQRAKLYFSKQLWIRPQKVVKSRLRFRHDLEPQDLFTTILQEQLVLEGLWITLDTFQKSLLINFGFFWGSNPNVFDFEYWEERLAEHDYPQTFQLRVRPVTM